MLINFENFKSNLDGLAHIFNIYVFQISITKKLLLISKECKIWNKYKRKYVILVRDPKDTLGISLKQHETKTIYVTKMSGNIC